MASRLGGTLSGPLSRAVELSEVGVPEQPAMQRGQQAVEAFPPHMVKVQPVRFPKSTLV